MTEYTPDPKLVEITGFGKYWLEQNGLGCAPSDALRAIEGVLANKIRAYADAHRRMAQAHGDRDLIAPDPAVDVADDVAELITIPPLVAVNGYGDVIAETTEVEFASVAATEASLAEIMDQIRARVLEPIADIDAREAAALAEVAAALPQPVEDEVVHPPRFA